MPPTILTRGWGHIGNKWTNCVRRFFVPDGFSFLLESVEAMEEVFADAWYYGLRSAASQGFRYEGYEWMYHDEEDIPQAGSWDQRYPGNGFSSGGCLPLQSSYLLQYNTSADSPTRTRGLTYLPGVTDAWITGTGVIETPYVGVLAQAAEWLVDPGFDIYGRPWKGCVWRRETKEAFPIAGIKVNRTIATQRRRGLLWPRKVFPPWI